jgi:hypothetical protein
MSRELIEAALLHFKAEKARAEANLNIYLYKPSAVGEHPDLVEEVIKLTKIITEADEAIKYLENL